MNGAIAAACASVLMGTLGFFVRSSQVSSLGCAFARFGVGFVLLLGVVVWVGLVKKQKLVFSWMSILAGMSVSLCVLFYFVALQKVAMGLAAFLTYLGPLLATIGDAVWRKSLPNRRDVCFMALALLGIVIVSAFPVEGEQSYHSLEDHSIGIMSALLAAVFYALYIIFNGRISDECSIIDRSFWQFAAGVVVLCIPMCAMSHVFDGLSVGWPYLLVIGVCQGGLVLVLISYAVKQLSTIQYCTISYLEPVVALLVGCFVFYDVVSLLQCVGFVFIIVASFTPTYLAVMRKRHIKKLL